MKAHLRTIIALIPVAAAILSCCNSNDKAGCKVELTGVMPGIEQGYEQGVSACYAATTNDALYIAGGCNFPGTPAAEGGSKVYYKGIYRTATDKPFEWEKIGELPVASAYGVTLQHDGRWYIIGGMNSDSAHSAAYCIELATNEIKQLPSLPYTIDNATGAIAGNTLYIAGGNCNGKPSNRVFAFTPGCEEKWRELPPLPSAARVQPVCAATGEALYVWGGFSPAGEHNAATVHCDGMKYVLATGEWEMLGEIKADDGTITLSGGSAVACDNRIVATGGVDKEIFLDAISGRYSLVAKDEYMYKPNEWYRFNSRLMLYDTENEEWSIAGNNSNLSRAGAVIVKQGSMLYQVGGELKPGIRSAGIYRITID